jgi:hypothetical protein
MMTRVRSRRLCLIPCSALAALAATVALGVACGGKAVMDDGAGGSGGGSSTITTTSTTSSGTSTTTSSGTTSTSAPPLTECEQACTTLFECTQIDGVCPGIGPGDGPTFIPQCALLCEQNPALIALIDPQDCAGTIATLSSLNQQFAALCAGG